MLCDACLVNVATTINGANGDGFCADCLASGRWVGDDDDGEEG